MKKQDLISTLADPLQSRMLDIKLLQSVINYYIITQNMDGLHAPQRNSAQQHVGQPEKLH